ncbi:uncharacterized protein LOC124207862 [Daphnia pulex]|uniref:uncharacterized protein LOC124207862 n=1 Tax=Daphnia pulex TaxID=6669 RepID=UPI001EDD3874|nr:uncharacterized protein LOC124207862 [Daphnia pulex]
MNRPTSNEAEEQINDSSKLLTENLLKELFQTGLVKVLVPHVTGVLIDALVVSVTTFVGTLARGQVGALIGAATGITIIIIPKAMGHGNYKPLMAVIKEDMTEEDRDRFLEIVWNQGLKYCLGKKYSENQLKDPAVMNSAVTELKKNPEAIETIENVVNQALAEKKMSLAKTE